MDALRHGPRWIGQNADFTGFRHSGNARTHTPANGLHLPPYMSHPDVIQEQATARR